ncbi:2559_t:CDS:2, partial [Gigaspora margarita]
ELTELSIQNGSMYAGLTRNVRKTGPLVNHNKVWRGNLACNIIEKDEFQLDKKVQQMVYPSLFKHKKEKQSKDWIIFEDQRSKSWMLERIEKKRERKLLKKNNCITEIKIENVKGCIHNMTKNKEHWILPCALDLLLKRQHVESPSELKLIDLIEIAKIEIELINGLNLKKETKDMLSSFHKEETHIRDNKRYYIQYTGMLLPTIVEGKM